MECIKNIIVGALIGVANIIPGVSGGTMAVIFDVYDKLIFAVTGFFKDWKKHIAFLLQICIGGAAGILLFSRVIKFLLAHYPMQTNYFFMGLIIGTFPLLIQKAGEKRIKKFNFIWMLLAFGAAFGMSKMGDPQNVDAMIQTLTFSNGIKFFFGGFIAAAVMILPGVSGSLALMIMGLYSSVIDAIITMNLPLLIVLALGVGLGTLSMAKLLEVLLKKYPQSVYFAILGLVAGSIFAVYPGFAFSSQGIVSCIALLLGGMIAFFFGRIKA